MDVDNKKPHLFMRKGFWICSSAKGDALSNSPIAAYLMWKVSMLRNGMLWIDD